MSLSPSFDPHGVYFFNNASSTSPNGHSLTSQGLSAYPAHILVASTSTTSSSSFGSSTSSRAPPPGNSPASVGQSALGLSFTQASPIPMQSPQPRHPAQTRGFAIGTMTSAATGQRQQTEQKKNGPIFEPFKHERANTPDLDEVIKKKTGQWNQWELEQSLKDNTNK